MTRRDQEAFVLVIPVRNPQDKKVVNYSCIEAVLHETVRSLTQQTYSPTHIIIVCHKIPSWAGAIGNNVTFLNVSNIPAFLPNTNPVRVDKGLKYIIGILYAKYTLNPGLIMPMDADDYVNVKLASKLANKGKFNKEVDGYILKKGLHIKLQISADYSVNYEAAYLVKEFDRTCGSCRVFKTDALMKSIKAIDIDIASKFSCWPLRSQNASVTVPAEPVMWLSDISQPHYLSENNIVNILGRHINQGAYFNLVPLAFVGAAKGCGHGNHDGPKQGEVHMDKSIRTVSAQQFCSDFGILNENYSKPAHKKINLRFLTNGFPSL